MRHDHHETPVYIVHVHLHQDSESSPLLAGIQAALTQLLDRSDIIMSAMDTLTAAVAKNKSGIASAVTLLQGLKAALDKAIGELPDTSSLEALSTELGTQDATLAAAVLANTPTPQTPPILGPTTTTVTVSQNPTTVGTTVALSAAVSGTPIPTGTVAFLDGTLSLGIATLSAGVAVLDAAFSTTDPHSITAAYSGDVSSAPSTSAAVDVVVS